MQTTLVQHPFSAFSFGSSCHKLHWLSGCSHVTSKFVANADFTLQLRVFATNAYVTIYCTLHVGFDTDFAVCLLNVLN